MNFFGRCFNLNLLALIATCVVAGCATGDKSRKLIGVIRVHLQSSEQVSAGKVVSILRSQPLLVRVAADPFLTEYQVDRAEVIENPGGFAVAIHFNHSGTVMLEQYAAANPGKHFAIFGQWGEKLAEGRWLAAPLINRRLADGTLTFTPDASRDEMDEFVKGLNNSAAKINRGSLK